MTGSAVPVFRRSPYVYFRCLFVVTFLTVLNLSAGTLRPEI